MTERIQEKGEKRKKQICKNKLTFVEKYKRGEQKIKNKQS